MPRQSPPTDQWGAASAWWSNLWTLLLVSSVCVCVCDQKGVMLTHQCRILCSVPSFFPHTRWTVTLPFRPMWGLLPRSSSTPTCALLVRTLVCISASEWPVRVCFDCSTGEIVVLRLPSSTTTLQLWLHKNCCHFLEAFFFKICLTNLRRSTCYIISPLGVQVMQCMYGLPTEKTNRLPWWWLLVLQCWTSTEPTRMQLI